MHERVSVNMLLRISLLLLSITLGFYILRFGYVLFMPLAFAFLAALFLYPVIRFFSKFKFGPNSSALLTVFLFILLASAVIFFIGLELSNFLKDIPNVTAKLSGLIEDVEIWGAKHFHFIDVQNKTEITQSINKGLKTLIGSFGSTLLQTIRIIIMILIFLVTTFFILVYHKLLKQFVFSLFSELQRPKVHEVTIKVRSLINKYLLGLLTEMAIVFSIIFLLLLLFGVKYSLLIALLAAIMNCIPYIGIYTVAAVAILMALVYNGEVKAIETGCVFLTAHLIDANVLIPYIVGHKVKINPFIAFIALIVGELIWGIPGMVLFIPYTAIFRIIVQNIDGLKPLAFLIGEEKEL